MPMNWKQPETKPEQRAHVEACMKLLKNAKDTSTWRFVDDVIEGLVVLLGVLRNRSPMQRGRATADSMTPQKRADILRIKAEQPKLAHQEIANRLNLNVGRVSEVLRGKRGERRP